MKIFRKVIIIIILIFCVFLSTTKTFASEEVGADFRNRIIKYQLENPFVETPNTFEAIVKLEKETSGDNGYIFGNTTFSTVSVNYRVDSNGKLVVEWNSYEKLVTFEKTDLRTGNWEHIAVVRNKENNSFDMYLNGNLIESLVVGVGKDVKDFSLPHLIGGDYNSRNALKIPFNGMIKQITVYSSSLTADEIERDYLNSDNISYKTRDNLMFNGYLSLGDIIVKDTSLYRNDAKIASNDYFYEGEMFSNYDYSFAILPDIQMLTKHYPSMIKTMPEYVNSIVDKHNIQMMITVGDLTDGASDAAGWKTAYTRISSNLNKLKIPYVPVPGNHDYDDICKKSHNLTYFDQYFPISTISKWDSWGGTYNGSVCNAYYLINAGGVDYLIFALDFAPSDEVLAWCCEITEQYPNHRVIASTHGFLSGDNRLIKNHDYNFSDDRANGVVINNSYQMWDKWLRKYENIFMVYCGHVISDDILTTQMVGDNGNVVSAFMVNGQGVLENNGLEALVAIYGFDEKNQLLYINYVSCISEKLYNIQNQFVIDFSGYSPINSSQYSSDVSKVKNEEIKLNSLTKVVSEAKLLNQVNVNYNDTQANNSGQVFNCVLLGLVAIILVFGVAKCLYQGGKHEKN